MDRRERRRRERERKKMEVKLREETSQPHKDDKGGVLQSRAKSYFGKTISGTKLVKGLFFSGLALASGYALFHPHVSVEPGILLNPGDPFSTQFTVTNDNRILGVQNLRSSCSTVFVETDHNIRLVGLPARPSDVIPRLGPQEQTTIDCPSWVSGFGGGVRNVVKSYIAIRVSYIQDWWPLSKNQVFPFKGATDSQKSVHWTHRTPSDFK